MTWRRFLRDRAAVVALVVLVALLVMAIVGPLVVTTDPATQSLILRRQLPSADHPFGLDHLGRDVFARVVFGARYTMLGAFAATILVSVIGVAVGLASGYYRGWVDQILMRLVDIALAFPFFLTAIVIVAILGANLANAVVAIALARAPSFIRVVRGSVLQSMGFMYVDAARAVGCSNGRIMTRHILPNILLQIIVLATVEMAGIILSLSGLSFLGLGAQPPASEWGLMLNDAKGYLAQAPHIMAFPGVFLAALVLSVNLLGDGLRYAADPRGDTRR